MDQQINAYIDALIIECLNSPIFTNNPPVNKDHAVDTIREILNNAIIDVTIDHLTPDQVLQLQNIDPDSQEMESKLMEFSATIPNLGVMIESRLNQEVENIKKQGLSF